MNHKLTINIIAWVCVSAVVGISVYRTLDIRTLPALIIPLLLTLLLELMSILKENKDGE